MSATTAPPPLVFTGILPKDPRLLTRDHATFLRDSLRETAAEHHRRHIPWHFTRFAAAKYGYKPRSRRYQALKIALGRPEPLVWTGATRAQVTTSRQIKATQKKATLIMRLPVQGGTGRFRIKKGQTELSRAQKTVLQMVEEIRAIAGDETRYLADFLKQRYLFRVNQPGTPFRMRNRAAAA